MYRINQSGCQYKDVYYGDDAFFGCERAWRGGELAFVMQYCGRVLSLPEGVRSAQVIAHLQQSLMQVSEEQPFRGPETCGGTDSFLYENLVFGSLNHPRGFHGEEHIVHVPSSRLVYVCLWHGFRPDLRVV